MSSTEEEVWLASTDEEWWSSHEEYGSREEAIAGGPEALGLDPGDSYWVGIKGIPRPAEIDAGDVIEQMALDMSDSEEGGGDAGEDWLAHVTKEEKDQLEESLNVVWRKWLKDNELLPEWFVIHNVTKHEVPVPAPPQVA